MCFRGNPDSGHCDLPSAVFQTVKGFGGMLLLFLPTVWLVCPALWLGTSDESRI